MLDSPARFAHVFCVRSRVDRHQPDKGDGCVTSGEFRLHLTAAYLVATDALTEAGFVLVKKQNCRRANSIELWTGVQGESQTPGGEVTIGVEGGGPGGRRGRLVGDVGFRIAICHQVQGDSVFKRSAAGRASVPEQSVRSPGSPSAAARDGSKPIQSSCSPDTQSSRLNATRKNSLTPTPALVLSRLSGHAQRLEYGRAMAGCTGAFPDFDQDSIRADDERRPRHSVKPAAVEDFLTPCAIARGDGGFGVH